MKHAHKFKFDSFKVNGHTHRLMGVTGYSISLWITHVHFYRGVCSYNGHTHYFSGVTGIPKKTKNGHFHKMSGFLVMTKNHEHKYNDYTNENIEYSSKKSAIGMVIGSK